MHLVWIFIQDFSLHRTGLHGHRPKSPPCPRSPRPGPHPAPFSRPAVDSRHSAPGNEKRRQDCRQSGEALPHGEAVEPPLFVPVFGDRLSGELFDGQSIGLRSGEDRFHDVGREVVQGKDSCDV